MRYLLLLIPFILLSSCDPMRHLKGTKLVLMDEPMLQMMSMKEPEDPEAMDPMHFSKHINERLANYLKENGIEVLIQSDLPEGVEINQPKVYSLQMPIHMLKEEGAPPQPGQENAPINEMIYEFSYSVYYLDKKSKMVDALGGEFSAKFSPDEQAKIVKKDPNANMVEHAIDKTMKEFAKVLAEDLAVVAKKN